LDVFVHPALFWLFGLRSAERVVQQTAAEDALLKLRSEHAEA
jgi:hypothetical protein